MHFCLSTLAPTSYTFSLGVEFRFSQHAGANPKRDHNARKPCAKWSATVSSRQGAQTVSGAGTGKVRVSVPLAPGAKSYTISWAATFDNGNHQCPSVFTPENETPKPFVVTAE